MNLLLKILILLFFTSSLAAQSVNEQLFEQAEKNYQAAVFDKAIPIYENLLKDENFLKRELAFFHLGNAYSFLQRSDSAYAALARLLEEFPQTVYLKPVLTIMVNYLISKKDHKTAMELLEQRSGKIEDDEQIKKIWLDVYEAKEDLTGALVFLEKNFPQSPWFNNKKIFYLRRSKEYQKGIDYIKTALPLFPSNDLLESLAEFYELNKDYDNSAGCYEDLYKKTAQNDYLIKEARMLLSHNLNDKARTVITRLIPLLGDNINTYSRVADIYKELGVYDELLKFYDEGIKKGYSFQQDKVMVYEIMGQYDKAVYNYLSILNYTNYPYIESRMINLAVVEEQSEIVERSLMNYEDKFAQKKSMIFELEMQIYLRLDQYAGLFKILKSKYLPMKKIQSPFLENVINVLFSNEYYDYVADLYKLLPRETVDSISPLIKLRYGQSLYLLKRYELSLQVLNSLNTEALRDAVIYYKALNYVKLKNFSQTLPLLKNYNTYESFDLNFKILLMQRKIRDAKELIQDELKKKRFLLGDLAYNEIMAYLFLNEEVIAVQDIKKFLEIYPQFNPANDLALILFFLQNDFVKNKQDVKLDVISFFKFYYLEDFQQSVSFLKKLNFQAENLDSIVKYFLSKCYIQTDDPDTAINTLNSVISKKSFVKPYALELLGWIYQNKKNNFLKANEYYKQILADYPSFINVNIIRKLAAK